MRILHVTDRLSRRGGADLCLLGLLEAQRAEHDLHLACGRDDGTASAPCARTIVPGLEARVREPTAIDEIFRRLRPDVIHLHNVVNPTVLEWGSGRRALLSVQDHRFFCPGRGKWTRDGSRCGEPMSEQRCAACFTDRGYFEGIFATTHERLSAIRGFASIVVLSHYMKRELRDSGVEPSRISVIPPFVHGLRAHGSHASDGSVLFVGRLVEAKGAREAVEIWRRSGLDRPLRFAGTGTLRAEIERSGCEVLGWVGRRRLAGLYRFASALLMPSRWQEPFGLAGLEALSLGTPVVAWSSGGIPEWHPGEGLVDWGDLDGAAAALRRMAGRRAEAPPGFDRRRAVDAHGELYRRLSEAGE